jgi:hypothetical protein
MALHTLNLSTRWSSEVSFMPWPFHRSGKSPWYLLDRKLSVPKNCSGDCWEKKDILPPPGIKPWYLSSIAYLRLYTYWTIPAPKNRLVTRQHASSSVIMLRHLFQKIWHNFVWVFWFEYYDSALMSTVVCVFSFRSSKYLVLTDFFVSLCSFSLQWYSHFKEFPVPLKTV